MYPTSKVSPIRRPRHCIWTVSSPLVQADRIIIQVIGNCQPFRYQSPVPYYNIHTARTIFPAGAHSVRFQTPEIAFPHRYTLNSLSITPFHPWTRAIIYYTYTSVRQPVIRNSNSKEADSVASLNTRLILCFSSRGPFLTIA